MKYLRYAILWEIYLILTALATLASYYLNFPFLHGVGFIYNLFPIKYYIGTSVWSVQYYSLYNFIQTFPLIYLGVIFISSNTSYMVRKLNIVGVFLIMGDCYQPLI